MRSAPFMKVRRPRLQQVVVLGGAAIATTLAFAKPSLGKRMVIDDFQMAQQTPFAFEGAPLGGPRAPTRGPAPAQAGGAIAAIGQGALVIDADSGTLVRLDDQLAATASLAIGPGAAQLVYDPITQRAFVADRAGDRVVVVAVAGKKLTRVGAWKTPAEPFGVALSPDGGSLLVTTVADRALVALSTADGKEQWRHALASEPRGVAISTDGKEALVGYLTTGTVERIALGDARHAGRHVALQGPSPGTRGAFVDPSQPREVGQPFARNAFAVRFIGNDLAIRENTGSYGGGFTPPIEHRLAFLGPAEGGVTAQVGARIAIHQPQAMAWDGKTDRLYVAGYGSDDLLTVDSASQASAALLVTAPIGKPGTVCGPQGLAVSDDGSVLVWCGVSRKVARVHAGPGALSGLALSGELTKSRLSPIAHRGLELFRAANDARLSNRGALACASCHPEGKDDGLSWRIEGHVLQTPLLSGRIVGTHPYKWDGGDPNLQASLSSTMRRLGGTGLAPDDVKALSAFLEAQPAPRHPTRDRAAVARGKHLFDGELGCTSCHDGAVLTDRTSHDFGHEFGAAQLKKIDTPSLIGLASSAPYYHDGSAATLPALLRDNASVHGMSETAQLTDPQIADLVAYLETL
ncbi:MAG: c-type cytochrome [Deltaproteobacteria bacterium]|nr:c-type cytochrome [Deltaproteobacteria bacterium]